jgi:hypothetical protein
MRQRSEIHPALELVRECHNLQVGAPELSLPCDVHVHSSRELMRALAARALALGLSL